MPLLLLSKFALPIIGLLVIGFLGFVARNIAEGGAARAELGFVQEANAQNLQTISELQNESKIRDNTLSKQQVELDKYKDESKLLKKLAEQLEKEGKL